MLEEKKEVGLWIYLRQWPMEAPKPCTSSRGGPLPFEEKLMEKPLHFHLLQLSLISPRSRLLLLLSGAVRFLLLTKRGVKLLTLEPLERRRCRKGGGGGGGEEYTRGGGEDEEMEGTKASAILLFFFVLGFLCDKKAVLFWEVSWSGPLILWIVTKLRIKTPIRRSWPLISDSDRRFGVVCGLGFFSSLTGVWWHNSYLWINGINITNLIDLKTFGYENLDLRLWKNSLQTCNQRVFNIYVFFFF